MSAPPHNAPPVHTDLAALPRLWDDSATFFADLYAIFYGEPEKTRQLQNSVVGFFAYGGRLIPMLNLLFGGGRNTLMLQETPDPDALAYFRSLGLSLPDIRVVDHRRHGTFHEGVVADPRLTDILKASPAPWLDGYVTDPHLERLATRLNKRVINSTAQSMDANNKVALHRFIKDDGLPCFDGGEVAPGKNLQRSLDDLQAQGYRRAVVRSAWGASGFGVAVIDLGAGDPDLPHHLTVEPTVLVQGWIQPGVRGIDEVSSPSVQFFVGDGGIQIFDLTGQLLKADSIHEGNVSPPTDICAEAGVKADILDQSAQVTRWVAATGYRGLGSIDYIVDRRGERVTVRVCEVNARVTGASYPSLLARRLRPGSAWLMRNFGFHPTITCAGVLDALDRGGHLYHPNQSQGVLPINVIRDDEGRVIKCQLLFLAPTAGACQQLVRPCLSVLPVKEGYASD